ncbi:uncharacterized protein Aud_002451 [Aspergillus udagawae]|uniref:Uncharacterized protein n=1 Tax=Aspergillus udagawae TaxID=91492 RepID=A0A8E0QMN8_9EURO|nr:uncharacterized protein Aud_002451 [Aspergillus udagawae]GIC86089.1 hypothetical protein Aud_002451 [Aspergillus udagawae]
MVGLLLVPYNDSMRLGQGYDSFLQEARADGAVTFGKERISQTSIDHTAPVSQVVSYSSRFVEKLSDITQSMNISAGSSIKSGTIEVSGSSLTVDEAKFSSSDINAVVSVKVINRFVEGGELHGIVSVRALDRSKKSSIESALKSALNSATDNKDFTLSASGVAGGVDSALSASETTISVNWMGGGQVKNEHDEWSLQELFKAAAAFPARVSKTPKRTHAILTKYDNNLSFLAWAQPRQIKIPQYDASYAYARELLDMYMTYKAHMTLIQAALAAPEKYQRSEAVDAVDVSIRGLATTRKMIRAEMSTIVEDIDKLDKHPELAKAIEAESRVTAPELWAVRLPVKISNGFGTSDAEAVQMIENGLLQFSFENGPPVEEPAAPKPDPIRQALEETMASTQAECVKLAEKVAETQRALEITQAELARTQEQLESSRKAQEAATVDHRVALEAAQRDVEASKTDTVRVQTALSRLESYVSYPANSAVCILSVVYGSRFYDNKQSVIDRLRYLIERHEEFKITNDVCEDDPLYGTRKMLVVVYRFTESSRVGRIRVLAGWEGDSARFDALDST